MQVNRRIKTKLRKHITDIKNRVKINFILLTEQQWSTFTIQKFYKYLVFQLSDTTTNKIHLLQHYSGRYSTGS
jgi:hypothetical protein